MKKKADRMRQSTLYKNLKKRIGSLKTQFCNFDSTQSALPKNQDKLRAFKLLVHAEIEFYIEKHAQEILNICEREWISNKRVLTPLVFLIMYSTSKFDPEANASKLIKEGRIEQIISSYKNAINNNHGIKQKHIILLTIPLGVDYRSIDNTWLATLDSYGTSRGSVAHNSFSMQQQLDLNDELSTLNFIMLGLKKMDIQLQKTTSNRKRPF